VHPPISRFHFHQINRHLILPNPLPNLPFRQLINRNHYQLRYQVENLHHNRVLSLLINLRINQTCIQLANHQFILLRDRRFAPQNNRLNNRLEFLHCNQHFNPVKYQVHNLVNNRFFTPVANHHYNHRFSQLLILLLNQAPNQAFNQLFNPAANRAKYHLFNQAFNPAFNLVLIRPFSPPAVRLDSRNKTQLLNRQFNHPIFLL
jgi:hypothetical protein